MTIYRLFEMASYIIDFYLLLVSLRIILSWFASYSNPSGLLLLTKMTDPFLNIFRGVRLLRFGFLNFSIIIAVLCLVFTSSLFKQFSLGVITFSIILETFVTTLLNGVASIMLIFVLISFIRTIGIFVKVSQIEPLWYRLDSILQPMLAQFMRFLFPRRDFSYETVIALFLITTFCTMFMFRFLLISLLYIIRRIPF